MRFCRHLAEHADLAGIASTGRRFTRNGRGLRGLVASLSSVDGVALCANR
jgi:hypothetical protein